MSGDTDYLEIAKRAFRDGEYERARAAAAIAQAEAAWERVWQEADDQSEYLTATDAADEPAIRGKE